MKVWIDQDLCTGDGLCEELAPAVFTLLEDNIAYVKEGDRVFSDPGGAEGLASVPDGMDDAVIEAADAAPDGQRKLQAAARSAGIVPFVIGAFGSAELSLALGRSNVVHAALLSHPASEDPRRVPPPEPATAARGEERPVEGVRSVRLVRFRRPLPHQFPQPRHQRSGNWEPERVAVLRRSEFDLAAREVHVPDAYSHAGPVDEHRSTLDSGALVSRTTGQVDAEIVGHGEQEHGDVGSGVEQEAVGNRAASKSWKSR